jgi:hypothetical protein
MRRGREGGRMIAPCNSIIQKPWALIARGGRTDKGVQLTRMAFLVETIFTPGRGSSSIAGYRARIGNQDLKGWTATNRTVRLEEILVRWYTPPSVREIRRARRAAFLELERRRQISLPLATENA